MRSAHTSRSWACSYQPSRRAPTKSARHGDVRSSTGLSLRAALDELDPVLVRIAHEAQARAALADRVGRTLGLDALPGQALQGRVQIVDGDRNVAVAGADLVRVDAEVVGQLE